MDEELSERLSADNKPLSDSTDQAGDDSEPVYDPTEKAGNENEPVSDTADQAEIGEIASDTNDSEPVSPSEQTEDDIEPVADSAEQSEVDREIVSDEQDHVENDSDPLSVNTYQAEIYTNQDDTSNEPISNTADYGKNSESVAQRLYEAEDVESDVEAEDSPMQQSPDQSRCSEEDRCGAVMSASQDSQDSVMEAEADNLSTEAVASSLHDEMETEVEAKGWSDSEDNLAEAGQGDTGASSQDIPDEQGDASQAESDGEMSDTDSVSAGIVETKTETFESDENLISLVSEQQQGHSDVLGDASDPEIVDETEGQISEVIGRADDSTNGNRDNDSVNYGISSNNSNNTPMGLNNTDMASIVTDVSPSDIAGAVTENVSDDELDINDNYDIRPAEDAQPTDNNTESSSAVADDTIGQAGDDSADNIVEPEAEESDTPISGEGPVSTPALVQKEDSEKDEGELSEASLEEVSEDEDGLDTRDDMKGAESGIEEVSDEEDEDEGAEEGQVKEAANVSGMEEISEDEEEELGHPGNMLGTGRAINGMSEAGKVTANVDENAISDDDIVEANAAAQQGKGMAMSDGEVEDGERHEATAGSGMEEVSEEEDGDESGGEQNEEGDKEEGMEDVSSDEEEEEEDDDDDKDGDDQKPPPDGMTADVTQNGDIATADDTGKEDSVIVQEILENMTIKIENLSGDNVERTTSRPVRSDGKEKSRRRKDRRESTKSRTSSGAAKSDKKDLRDINERLKAQASYNEDIELDYDDIHEETKEKAGSESGSVSSSSSDEGELSEEEDCEEGEIREPGSQKPFTKPTCRFFMRGHCTWGINCRFLHPGVNDKGYYQLIERPGFNNKPPPPVDYQSEEEERSPSPERPPTPVEPKEETAWERGLRQAKELRKKALERKEHEENFEHKKLNLSIEENPEYNKENKADDEKKERKKKAIYYEKEVFSDDEYYDQTPVRQQQKQQQEQAWLPGQYENFEVHWAREPGGGAAPGGGYYPPHPQARSHYPPQGHLPPGRGGAPGGRYNPQYAEQSFRGREGRFPQRRPSPKRYSMSPPPQYQGNQRYARPPPDPRMEIPLRREKVRERSGGSPPTPKDMPGTGGSKIKADEWHDPWRRSNANKPKSPSRKRSRSRGRRRSRRSHSYSSSYSSSSYSGSSRSRSRSSSFSSVSSRSRSRSRSRSSSASSRSPPPRRNVPVDRRRPSQTSFQGNRRMPPHDQPRSAVAMHGRGRGRSPDKRPGMGHQHPGRGGMNKGPPGMQSRGAHGRPHMMGDPRGDPRGDSRGDLRGDPRMGGMPPRRGPGGQIADVGRKMDRGGPPPRRFQMDVKTRDRPLPPSALRERRPSRRGRSGSSSRSRSRSSSSSSRSSRSSSYSSRSSRSRSSSSSSSGSADSDHLYRNIGGKEQRPGPPGRGRPGDKSRYKPTPDGRQKMPSRMDAKPMMFREGEFGKPMTALPQKPKDPLKVTGQKSNIKLTLIKPSDKAPGGPDQMSKKRPADHDGAPPPKRPSMASQAKTGGEKLAKKGEKPGPVSPTKPIQSPMKAAAAAVAAGAAGGGLPPAGRGAGPATAGQPGAKKRSAGNRREELLQQLKAVEDAIAKKKKKMT